MVRRAEDLWYVSRQAYLDAERVAPTKSEWVDGVVYAMAGASRNHVAAVSRIMGHLIGPAEERGCFIGAADMLVETATANYYPDVVVSCDPSLDPYVEHHPCFIAEVLSPSTNRVDRAEKRDAYLSLPSMQNYWIVDAENKVIEVWSRTDDGWKGSHQTAAEPVPVGCLGLMLRVVDVVGV